jgi:hypothetical protein
MHLVRDVPKMLAQRLGHPRKISVIPKHHLFWHGKIQLRRGAFMTKDDPERVKRLLANLVLPQKVIAPGLIAQVNGQFEFR